ncbi:MAG TPA: trypsin-like peptidase domain-containing protein, partial [Longimicrobiaceae bacterium]|nr:trypsin-like peptidase domain-containing protein [Longimicrobiaceae bacterium]
MRQLARKLALPGALVLGLGTAASAVEVVRTGMRPVEAQATAPALRPGSEPQSDAASLSSAFRAASRAAFPGVVYVEVEAMTQPVSVDIPPELRGTPFEQFFGNPRRMAPQSSSVTGSGFILSQDGYILTNNHVVSRANRVKVTLTDKREFTARVVGRDPNTDVAVLKVEAAGLPTIRIGTSDELQMGDWVLALGYPMSLGETTTAGIVSAKGRNIGIMERNEGATQPLEHFIQTDAVINPGNSGGPLVNLRGEVVGMNTAIASPTGFYAGYGFAVPITLVRRVADDLIRFGAVRRPMIGVNIRDVTPADKNVFRLDRVAGAVVGQETQGPAREAGLAMGDVITAVDGQPIDDAGDLMERVARKRPGDEVKLDVTRYGDRRSYTVRLSTLQVARADDEATRPAPAADAPAKLGLKVEEVDAATARQYGMQNGGGVVVTA